MSYAAKIEALNVELTEKKELLQAEQEKLAGLRTEAQAKQNEMDHFSIDADKYEDEYRNSLDETYDLPFGWSMATVMESQDPCMYREGLNDYADGLDKEEDDEYKELAEQLEEIETDIEQAEDTISDLENDIEDIEIEIEDLETEADGIED
ncbi:MAG: hypothetical protein ACRCYP_01850 [Alphaproteobacteria bacterium]